MNNKTNKSIIKWAIRIVGLLAIILLVWLIGPLISIGGYLPLGTFVRQTIAVIFIFCLWAGYFLYQYYKTIKANQRLIDDLSVNSNDHGVNLDNELNILTRDINEAIDLLRKSADGKKNKWFLYSLPWYIIIGPPGSGKTTALVNSGLHFPLTDMHDEKRLKGIGGTRNCDWWFTDHAVLIDTAGRYTTHDSHEAIDKGAWIGFLELLKKHRPLRPINGVIVAFSIADFLKFSDEDKISHARAIRSRIRELNERLAINIPVYLLFTKCDMLEGFVEFFEDLDSEGRQQVWGETFPVETPISDIVKQFTNAFEALIDRLDSRLIKRVQDEKDVRRRSLIFCFPREFATLKASLSAFLGDIFGANRFQQPLFLRGIYFSSGTQQGSPIDRLLGSLVKAFGFDRESSPAFRGQGKSYFITRLLTDVIFSESELVGSDFKRARQRFWLQKAIYVFSLLVFITVTTLWWISYCKNVAAVKRQNEIMEQYLSASYDNRWQLDFKQLSVRMDALDAVANQVFTKDDSSLMHFGLYQGHDLSENALSSYKRFLENYFLPAIRYRLEERMQVAINDNQDILYELLKTYLMLRNFEHLEPETLIEWIGIDWEIQFHDAPQIVGSLKKHLNYLISMQFKPVALNDNLIKEVRRTLTQVPLEYQVYGQIKNSSDADPYQIDVVNLLGPYADRVFTTTQGDLTGAFKIPGLYTRQGFQNVFLKLVPENIKLAIDQDWVLERTSTGGASLSEINALQQKILALYIQDYIANWDTMLQSLVIRDTTSEKQATELLGYISGKESPLKRILAAIAENTKLDDIQKTRVDIAGSIVGNKLGSKTKAALNELKQQSIGDWLPSVSPISQHFSSINEFVEGGENSLSEALIILLGKIYSETVNMQGATTFLGSAPAPAGKGASALGQQLRLLVYESERYPTLIKTWSNAVAQRISGEVSNSVKKQLNESWQVILQQCKEMIEGRYPFTPTSRNEVNLIDFGRFFSINGLIDSFYIQNLNAHIDRQGSTWKAKTTAGESAQLNAGSLNQFQLASKIKDKYFKYPGDMPVVRFFVKPIEISPELAKVRLEIDGQALEFDGHNNMPKEFRWPGGGAGSVRLEFETLVGNKQITFNAEGPWALYRFVDSAAGGTIRNDSERFGISILGLNGNAKFEITTGGGVNPFNTAEIRSFHCPRQI